jgi:Mn-dependent DtxR family transcriptional regulator
MTNSRKEESLSRLEGHSGEEQGRTLKRALSLLELLRENPRLSKDDLARRAGCSLATVYRYLGCLEKEGYLTFGRGKIEVKAQANGFLEVKGSERGLVIRVPSSMRIRLCQKESHTEIEILSGKEPSEEKETPPDREEMSAEEPGRKILNLPESALKLLPFLADNPRVKKGLLAQRLGCSLVTVYKYLHLLEEAGYVVFGRKVVTPSREVLRLLGRETKDSQAPLKIRRPISIYEVYRDKDISLESKSKGNTPFQGERILTPNRGLIRGLIIGGAARMIPDKPLACLERSGADPLLQVASRNWWKFLERILTLFCTVVNG